MAWCLFCGRHDCEHAAAPACKVQKSPPMPSTASIGKCVMGAYGSAGQARDALHAIKKHWGAERLPKHIALAADLVDQARRALFAAEAALSRVVRDPAQN